MFPKALIFFFFFFFVAITSQIDEDMLIDAYTLDHGKWVSTPDTVGSSFWLLFSYQHQEH